ncbi:OLC1v1001194C1 [Oldenlandia corymbosa var. corymbosa]|uniref:OLC1v1001194C1 n=1 Tax=Oldenlandia corymbosa var. corymbosa TaxID=529605 RepID=A0AAV1D531_OLDCO|nr:OLC1v1001194C1 [Oldenlandia corymbosa var. corymbosa]
MPTACSWQPFSPSYAMPMPSDLIPKRFYHPQVNRHGQKFGVDPSIEVLTGLGKAIKVWAIFGVDEFSHLVWICLETAERSKDEETSRNQVVLANKIFVFMKDMGVRIEEDVYGPFLKYLIDFGLEKEFYAFSDHMKEKSMRLIMAYYEMLLLIRLKDNEKIKAFYHSLDLCDSAYQLSFKQSCLYALSEYDQKEELLELLEDFDVSKLSWCSDLTLVFKDLGKPMLDSVAEMWFFKLMRSGFRRDKISDFIFDYTTANRNLEAQVVYSMFKNLHMRLGLRPTSHDRLIKYFYKTDLFWAIIVSNDIMTDGLVISLRTYYYLLNCCKGACDYSMFWKLFEVILSHGMKLDPAFFELMIGIPLERGESIHKILHSLKMLHLTEENVYKTIVNFTKGAKKEYAVALYREVLANTSMSPGPDPYICHCVLSPLTESIRDLNLWLVTLRRLENSNFWLNGCYKVLAGCVRLKELNTIVSLLKQVVHRGIPYDSVGRDIFFEVFLRFLRRASRLSMDFLLAACVSARDLKACLLIWDEYKALGIPYNIVTLLRMYNALLSLGDFESADRILAEIPEYDQSIEDIIKTSQAKYVTPP